MRDERQLRDLVSVGPAIERDFHLLGINTVEELARQEPKRLYRKLCALTGEQQDRCVLDVFSAAIAQARNPFLSHRQCCWWYWSRQRKAHHAKAS